MGTFVRNHDELDLERLSEREREEVYKAFAPREDMRIYGRGIRRRLAPMLKNNRKQMELVYSLMFSLPGTPVIRYGDEIGMGDDLSLPERNSVRTAMQWSGEQNAGFSACASADLKVAIISKGEFAYTKVNVQKQMRDPLSFMNWTERLISARKECIEFGYGQCTTIKADHPGILIHTCVYKNGRSLAIHNLTENDVNFCLKEDFTHLIEYFSDRQYDAVDEESRSVELSPFGYRWFRTSPMFAQSAHTLTKRPT